MNRIINVNVGGNYISKDKKKAGVMGEANVTSLRITFDESWDNYAKKVVFIDAHGANPVSIILGINQLEDMKVANVYLVPIPAEPMAHEGKMTFIIEGTFDNKIQKSFSDTLDVEYAPATSGATTPVEPTPTEVEQMQAQLDSILGEVRGAIEAKEDIQNMSVSADTLESDASATVTKTEQDGVVNLHFGIPRGKQGVRGLSGVYIGHEAPTDPDVNVWIDNQGAVDFIHGKSAYEIAVEYGYEGTEEEWLASLHAPTVVIHDTETEKAAILSAAGWQGSYAPYTQTVTVDGITTDTQGTVSVSESATDEQYRAAMYAALRKTAQGTNSITIKAYGEKPTVDIPLTVKVGG